MPEQKSTSAVGLLPRQQQLPIVEAEMTASKRKHLLGLAIMRANADIYLRFLVELVFNVTKQGTSGYLQKSFDQLAARPWGMCCTRSTAIKTAMKAERTGFLSVERDLYKNGNQTSNRYRINWDGIRGILFPGSESQTTWSESQTTWSESQTTWSAKQTHNKETSSYESSSASSYKKHDDDDGFKKEISDETWEQARELAREADGILFPPPHLPGRRLPHRDFLLASSVLALLRFDRHWLLEAARATKNRSNVRDKISFLRGVLRRKLHGLTFDGLSCSEETIDAVWNRLFVPLEKQSREFYAPRETSQEQPA